jgi:antitoxin CptB
MPFRLVKGANRGSRIAGRMAAKVAKELPSRNRQTADSATRCRYRDRPRAPPRLLALSDMELQDQTAEELELRRRRLRYRAWHRGTREMDLVLGRFVDAELANLTPVELDELETLMDAPDPDLLSWIMAQAEVPHDRDTPIFRRLAEFSRAGRGAGRQ